MGGQTVESRTITRAVMAPGQLFAGGLFGGESEAGSSFDLLITGTGKRFS
jgi:hypothetical protein